MINLAIKTLSLLKTSWLGVVSDFLATILLLHLLDVKLQIDADIVLIMH